MLFRSASTAWRSTAYFSSVTARHSSVMSREIDSRCDGLPSAPMIGETCTSRVARVAPGGIGGALEASDAAGFCQFHRASRFGIGVAGPEFGPWTTLELPEVVDFHHPLAAFAHDCRRPSRSRILMQSPHPASTLRRTSSLSAKPSSAAVNSLRRVEGGADTRAEAIEPFRTQ